MDRIFRSRGSLAFLCFMAAACAEAPPAERVFVETLGSDTIAVEAFSRTDSHVEGRIVSRNPATAMALYRADLDAAGRIERFEVSLFDGGNLDGPPSQTAVMTSDGGMARVIRTRADGTDTLDLELEGVPVPLAGRVPMAVGMVDYATRRAIAGGSGAMDFAMVWPTQGRVSPNAVEPRGEGYFSLDFFGNPMLVEVDETGAVQSVSGRETTVKVEIAPVETADLPALASDFAARDAAGTGLGTPSPTDTVQATVGAAELRVVYSRPAMRGREIWGGLVPHGSVWRTGANAATQFNTSRPIRLGDIELPAGAYTLWTTFTPDTATLIVNAQTGQWGTAYDAARDVGRTTLEQRDRETPAERFTIEIAGEASAAELHLGWDDRTYVAPISVR